MLLRIDQLLLPKLTSAYALGIYSAAVKISEVPNVLVGVMYVTLLSRVAPIIASDKHEDKKRVKQLFWLYFLLGLLVALFIIVFAKYAVAIIYGQQYLESIPVLQVYAICIPFMFLCVYYNSIFGALDRKKLMAGVYLVAAILNAFFVIILTPKFGLIGTALANVFTYSAAVTAFAIAHRYLSK